MYLFLCSLWALVLNIQTIPLLQQSKDISVEIKRLKEENKQFQFVIQQQTTLANIQLKAHDLGLVYPKFNRMNHILLHKKRNEE